MSKDEWYEPINGCCPKCGESVEECGGIELYHQTYYQPAEWGCLTLETSYYKDATTVILRHTDADGNECSIGEDNTDEYCYGCAVATDPYDYDEPDDYDDDSWDEPASWMVTESAY